MATTTLAALTPGDIYAKARHFRVDLAAEPFLLPLIKQAATTPLPPQWTAAELDAKAAFRNELTGELQHTHPADAYFLKQIHELRRYHEAHDGENQRAELSASAWMAFDDSAAGDAHKDATYYYDFVSQATQTTRPMAAATRCAEMPASARLDGRGGGDSPAKIFEHAASLHKAPSMKNLETLEILCFTSWWTESALAGSKKVYMQLYFSIPTRHFQIALDDSDDVFTISHIVGASGRVVGAWDLHVGARLQLLGRGTTLMQPSLLTRQWLELHERQFQAMKLELETELLKYELQSGHARKPLTGRILCADPHKSTSGVSLRKLLGETEALKSRLAKYRPDVARRFVIPFDADD